MKKSFLFMSLLLGLFVSVSVFALTACGSDNEPSGVGSEETLYGTWQQTSGYAIEDGEKHHEKSISADDAEYLRFGADGVCLVHGGERGHFYNNGSYSFSFDQEDKVLQIGYMTLTVEVLSGSTLRLKYSYSSDSEDGEVATYKKVSDKVWDNL